MRMLFICPPLHRTYHFFLRGHVRLLPVGLLLKGLNMLQLCCGFGLILGCLPSDIRSAFLICNCTCPFFICPRLLSLDVLFLISGG